MELPNGITEEQAVEAFEIFATSKAEGRLVPCDAYAIVTAISEALMEGDGPTYPGGMSEALFAYDVIKLTGIAEPDPHEGK